MTTVRKLSYGCLALAALAAGCGGSLPGPCEDGSCGTQTSSRRTFQTTINTQVDLLFVIDDVNLTTPDVGALTTGLADSAQAMLQRDPELSLHVGFVRAGTCDASPRGATCGIVNREEFARSEWCNTVTNFNFAGGLGDAFTCLADLGAGDCGPAQPLAAAVRALAAPPRAGWERFLRREAYLMIVFVAAADDASEIAGSPPPPLTFAETLKTLKPDPGQILVSVLGPGDCPGETQAPRLLEFVNQFGGNGLYAPRCGAQLPLALYRILEPASPCFLQPPCFPTVRDTDLAKPGLQAECAVESHVASAHGGFTTAALPGCDVASPPCWRLIPSSGLSCQGYLATIEYGADWCEEAARAISIECLGCANAADPACALLP
jgi:hypothetical protein